MRSESDSVSPQTCPMHREFDGPFLSYHIHTSTGTES